MNVNDPRLEQAHKDMTKRLAAYDDRIVTVLKNHLAIEQSLDELLKTARRSRKRTFAGKIDVIEKLFLPEIDAHVFGVLKAGNNLRNAIAHGKPEGTVTQRMADLRKAYLASLSPKNAEDSKGLTDSQLVAVAFTMAGSHVVVANINLEEKLRKR